MDGDEVIEAIRADYSGTFVIVSARTSVGDRAANLAVGADSYLTKAFRP